MLWSSLTLDCALTLLYTLTFTYAQCAFSFLEIVSDQWNPDTCEATTPGCSNACVRETDGGSCCYCEELEDLETTVCSCCPENTFCCPWNEDSPIKGNACCPEGSTCLEGAVCQRVVIEEAVRSAVRSRNVTAPCTILSPSPNSGGQEVAAVGKMFNAAISSTLPTTATSRALPTTVAPRIYPTTTKVRIFSTATTRRTKPPTTKFQFLYPNTTRHTLHSTTTKSPTLPSVPIANNLALPDNLFLFPSTASIITHSPADITTTRPPAIITTKRPPAIITTKRPPAIITTKRPLADITTVFPAAEITTKIPPAEVTTKRPVAPFEDRDTYLLITCNDLFLLFFDGVPQELKYADQWNRFDELLIPRDTKVIGILKLEFTYVCTVYFKHAHFDTQNWMCVDVAPPTMDWTHEDFYVEEKWKKPVMERNERVVRGMPRDATRIGAQKPANGPGEDQLSCCRLVVHNQDEPEQDNKIRNSNEVK